MKTTNASPENSPQQDAKYRLPFIEEPVDHSTLFGIRGEDPLFLRPGDIERVYNIPASTIYDWIHEQPETHFPAVKVAVRDESKRRLVLIPKKLFDQWIIEHATIEKLK